MSTQTVNITSAEHRARRNSLEAKLRELSGVSRQREDLQIENLADPIDQVTSNVERDMAVQHLDLQARRIQEVRAALDKLDEGLYGLCEHCDGPIPRKRLDALPWARLCVPCQSAEEEAAHVMAPGFRDAA